MGQLGFDGNFGYASNQLTEKDAVDKALGFCAGQNNVKCFVYAIGNKVVFTPQTRP